MYIIVGLFLGSQVHQLESVTVVCVPVTRAIAAQRASAPLVRSRAALPLR